MGCPPTQWKNCRVIVTQILLSLFFFHLYEMVNFRHTEECRWAAAKQDLVNDFHYIYWVFSTTQQQDCTYALCQSIEQGALEDRPWFHPPETAEIKAQVVHCLSFALLQSATSSAYWCLFSAQGGGTFFFQHKRHMDQSPSQSYPPIVSGVWVERGESSWVWVELGSRGEEDERRLAV